MKIRVGAFLMLGIVLWSGCDKQAADRDRFFLRGNVALAEGEIDRAIYLYDEALKKDPSYVDALNNRGIAYYERKEPVMALQDYNQALLIDPNYIDAYYNRSNAYVAMNRYEDAIADLKLVRNNYPDSAYVHFSLGLAYHKAAKNGLAKQSILEAITLDKENPESYINLGVVYFHEENYDSAQYFAREGLQLDEGQILAHNLLGMTYQKQGDFQESIAAYQKGLSYDRYNPVLLNNRSFVYLQLDSLKLAEADINQSIIKDPDNLWAYRNKGILFYKQERYEEALRLFERGYKESDYVEDLFSYMGLTHMRLDNASDACKLFQKGIEKGEILSKENSGGCNF